MRTREQQTEAAVGHDALIVLIGGEFGQPAEVLCRGLVQPPTARRVD